MRTYGTAHGLVLSLEALADESDRLVEDRGWGLPADEIQDRASRIRAQIELLRKRLRAGAKTTISRISSYGVDDWAGRLALALAQIDLEIDAFARGARITPGLSAGFAEIREAAIFAGALDSVDGPIEAPAEGAKQIPRPTQKTAATPSKTAKPAATANARMLEKIQSDLAICAGWTAAQWANELRCSRSTIVATKVWKDLAMARERIKTELATSKRRRRRASDNRFD